jgi:hypothetical protein
MKCIILSRQKELNKSTQIVVIKKREAVRQSRLFVTIFFKSTVEKNM